MHAYGHGIDLYNIYIVTQVRVGTRTSHKTIATERFHISRCLRDLYGTIRSEYNHYIIIKCIIIYIGTYNIPLCY